MVTPPARVPVRLPLPVGAGGSARASRHPVNLVGYSATPAAGAGPPVLVRRTEPAFVPALFADLRDRKDLETLGQPDVEKHPGDFEGDHRRLYQPIHRTYNLVLLEAACARVGSPRLDPRNVVGAGCVVRRVVEASRPDRDEAWRHLDGAVLGWGEPPAGLYRIDPDPKRRVRGALSRQPEVHARLAALLSPEWEGTEPVSPLFVAPPDVCGAVGKTVIYGIVPVTSSESRTVARAEPVDDQVVRQTTPEFLQALGRDFTLFPPGTVLTVTAVEEAIVRRDSPPSAQGDRLRTFVDQLQMVARVWQAFEPTPESRELLRRLDEHFVEVGPGRTRRPLGGYLAEACRRLILRTEAGSVEFPYRWTQPPAAVADGIREAARLCLEARLRESGPRVKRFDDPGALYRVHCFVRVRPAAGCPPELHWAPPSEPFRIVPWWDSSGTPVQTIVLPDLNRDTVRKLKPSVAFVIPPGLAGLLNQTSPKDLRDGNGSLPGVGLGWICSFSIPVITLCAFIVLNIFLTLFHLIFGWLFYLKICLPFPKPNTPPRP